MANLMDLLQGQIGEGLIDQLSSQLGGVDKQQTTLATQGIMSTLVSAMAKNAATPDGANALSNALDRDHDGSVLDNMSGLLGLLGGGGNDNSMMSNVTKAMNGAGILKHILGDRQSGAVDMISKASGLDSSKTGSLMTMLAPMLMGALGRQKQQGGMGAMDIASLLSGAVTQQRQSSGNPMIDMATKFLDADGDGSIMDDLGGMGMKILGNMFKK